MCNMNQLNYTQFECVDSLASIECIQETMSKIDKLVSQRNNSHGMQPVHHIYSASCINRSNSTQQFHF
jgi:hypothetical protein